MAHRAPGLAPIAGWSLLVGALALGGGVSATRADPDSSTGAPAAAQVPAETAASCQAPEPLEAVRLDPARLVRPAGPDGEFVSLNTRGYNYERPGSAQTAPQVPPRESVPHEQAEQPRSE